jgi:hypothetical protein
MKEIERRKKEEEKNEGKLKFKEKCKRVMGGCTVKKENKIFLIYGEILAHFLIY